MARAESASDAAEGSGTLVCTSSEMFPSEVDLTGPTPNPYQSVPEEVSSNGSPKMLPKILRVESTRSASKLPRGTATVSNPITLEVAV